MNYQIAVTIPSEPPQMPENTLPLAEWSIFAVISVILIRHLLAIDKAKRDADIRLIEKLIEDALEDN